MILKKPPDKCVVHRCSPAYKTTRELLQNTHDMRTMRPRLPQSLLHISNKRLTRQNILRPNMSTATKPSKAPDGASAMQNILESSQGEDWQQFLVETMRSISAPLAQRALAQVGLGAGTTEPYRLLEQGCGMGVVAPLLYETVPAGVQEKSSVLCGDFSAPLVEAVKKRAEKEGWVNCEAQVVDATVSNLLLRACASRATRRQPSEIWKLMQWL